jgi:hypothetical protein
MGQSVWWQTVIISSAGGVLALASVVDHCEPGAPRKAASR